MTLLPRSPGSTLVSWLHLAVLATMRPVLDPTGHRVPWTKPTCLLHTWRPHRQRPFVFVLHLHQHQSSCNLHLQYLAKNQSTQCCQSLITPWSDHPPVLEPHMVHNLPLDECITTHTYSNPREKRKEKKRIKETPTSDRKPRKGKEQDHLKKTSLGPLRQGQRLDTFETELCSRKERKPPNQSLKTTKSSPSTHASSPWTNATPPGRMHAKHLSNRAAPSALLWPVVLTGRPVDKIIQDLGTTPVRPVSLTGQVGATWEIARAQN
jgi:hypothetical protein